MSRPKNLLPRQEVHVRLLLPTLAKLNLICLDAFSGKISYAVRNDHLEAALAEYFERYYPAKATPDTQAESNT